MDKNGKRGRHAKELNDSNDPKGYIREFIRSNNYDNQKSNIIIKLEKWGNKPCHEFSFSLIKQYFEQLDRFSSFYLYKFVILKYLQWSKDKGIITDSTIIDQIKDTIDIEIQNSVCTNEIKKHFIKDKVNLEEIFAIISEKPYKVNVQNTELNRKRNKLALALLYYGFSPLGIINLEIQDININTNTIQVNGNKRLVDEIVIELIKDYLTAENRNDVGIYSKEKLFMSYNKINFIASKKPELVIEAEIRQVNEFFQSDSFELKIEDIGLAGFFNYCKENNINNVTDMTNQMASYFIDKKVSGLQRKKILYKTFMKYYYDINIIFDVKNSYEKLLSSTHFPTNTDFAAMEEYKKRIGDLGENYVFEEEIRKLIKEHRPDLAKNVSKDPSEDHNNGYDILSFTPTGEEIHIEVKATAGERNTPFFISDHERETANKYWQMNKLYEIHRVLNVTNSSLVSREIYSSLSDDRWLFEPVSYKVSKKKLY